ncbi:DUF805 domain-containing protein [Microcella daejeonensis]|uniref:DUF805 domain-containing protein n=1 Tax=Microcella daejeonensis TaxID=2994971 RepID=UPI0022702F01|nr:DUF805 domain-containing protein [Microcella daejeonensis]WAB84921.1 DUF805 domain-containing protein [Microcella daejeonensis]
MTTSVELDARAPLRDAGIRDSLRRFVQHGLRLHGRAGRSEYWWWMAANLSVLALTLGLVPAIASGTGAMPTVNLGPFGIASPSGITFLYGSPDYAADSHVAQISIAVAALWALATAIPAVTVTVRRLHDSNLSGWWALLGLLGVGSIALAVLLLRRPRLAGARFDA